MTIEEARELAAQAWCKDATSQCVMEPAVAEEFAKILVAHSACLRDRLAEWTDFDFASHALGVAIGMFPTGSDMSQFKGTFWSNNVLGNTLIVCLRELVVASVLEMNDDQQFRWKGK